MPNRIIKESICYSDQIDKLTPFQETVFVRLLVNVDDYGYSDARPALLKSKLFATKQDVTVKSVEEALRRLEEVGLVRPYEVDGKPFLSIPTWHEHQKLQHFGKNGYPPPPWERNEDLPEKARREGGNPNYDPDWESKTEALSKTFKSLEKVSQVNKTSSLEVEVEEEGEVEVEVTPPISPPGGLDALFDRFWSDYPKKKDKKKARMVFEKIKPDERLLDTMLEAIKVQKQSRQWTKQDGDFIPLPSTWLRNARWNDEIDVEIAGQDQERDYSGGVTEDPRWEAIFSGEA